MSRATPAMGVGILSATLGVCAITLGYNGEGTLVLIGGGVIAAILALVLQEPETRRRNDKKGG